MFPILQIGSLAIQVPGLILLIGIWIGLSLAERYASKWDIQPNQLSSLIIIGLISGLIGSRLSYLIRYPNYFVDNPTSIISLNPNLLDPIGGLVIGFLSILIYIQRKHMKLWATLDALTPAFAVLGIAIGLSHISSGSAYGMRTDWLWGIELWGAIRHPTQFYETLLAILILAVAWPGWKIWSEVQDGVYFLSFASMSAIARILVEAFRGDSLVLAGGYRANQLIAWFVLAFCLWGIYRLQNRQHANETVSNETR